MTSLLRTRCHFRRCMYSNLPSWCLGSLALLLFASGPLILLPHLAQCWPWRPQCQGHGLIAALCPAQRCCSGDNWRKPCSAANPGISFGSHNWQGMVLPMGTGTVPTSPARAVPSPSPCAAPCHSDGRAAHAQLHAHSCTHVPTWTHGSATHTCEHRHKKTGAMHVSTGMSCAHVSGHRHGPGLCIKAARQTCTSGTTSTHTHTCRGGAAVCTQAQMPPCCATWCVCPCSHTQPQRSGCLLYLCTTVLSGGVMVMHLNTVCLCSHPESPQIPARLFPTCCL